MHAGKSINTVILPAFTFKHFILQIDIVTELYSVRGVQQVFGLWTSPTHDKVVKFEKFEQSTPISGTVLIRKGNTAIKGEIKYEMCVFKLTCLNSTGPAFRLFLELAKKAIFTFLSVFECSFCIYSRGKARHYFLCLLQMV